MAVKNISEWVDGLRARFLDCVAKQDNPVMRDISVQIGVPYQTLVRFLEGRALPKVRTLSKIDHWICEHMPK